MINIHTCGFLNIVKVILYGYPSPRSFCKLKDEIFINSVIKSKFCYQTGKWSYENVVGINHAKFRRFRNITRLAFSAM